eukprot:jgi/Botrbrau1/4356/Bobra.105_2s0005.1
MSQIDRLTAFILSDYQNDIVREYAHCKNGCHRRRLRLFVVSLIGGLLLIVLALEAFLESGFFHDGFAKDYTINQDNNIPKNESIPLKDGATYSCPCLLDGLPPAAYIVLNCTQASSAGPSITDKDVQLCHLVSNMASPMPLDYAGNMLFKEDFARAVFKDFLGILHTARAILGAIIGSGPNGAAAPGSWLVDITPNDTMSVHLQCVFADAILSGLQIKPQAIMDVHFPDVCERQNLKIRDFLPLSIEDVKANRSLWIEDWDSISFVWDLASAYNLYLNFCNAPFCNVTVPKTMYRRIMEILSTFGGIYSVVLFLLISLFWNALRHAPEFWTWYMQILNYSR